MAAVVPTRDIVPVSGSAEGSFAPLRDIFGRMVGAQGKGGAALAIYAEGRKVVDLVGGDYRPDSVQLLFSVSKAITAVAAAMAHEAGLLDLDAPLSAYWPAFDRSSTRMITGRWVLSHRSGLCGVDALLSLRELLAGADEAALERQEPYWPPGTRHGYHGFSFGTLLDGAFRRVVGQRVGEFVSERISGPLGLDLWLSTPDRELPRVKPIVFDPPLVTEARAAYLSSGVPQSEIVRLRETNFIYADPSVLYNDPRFAQAGWPSSSGVAGARDLAKLLYATVAKVDGVRLLGEAATRAMVATQSRGPDAVLGIITHFGSGVQLPFPQLPLLGPGSFGHEAAGGSAVVADPELGVAVGYTTNVYPCMNGASTGFLALQSAIRHCVTAPSNTV
jgi:CubicO group peptidase (beta-lactamase class C family)